MSLGKGLEMKEAGLDQSILAIRVAGWWWLMPAILEFEVLGRYDKKNLF